MSQDLNRKFNIIRPGSIPSTCAGQACMPGRPTLRRRSPKRRAGDDGGARSAVTVAPRDGGIVLTNADRPYFQPSSPAKAGDPVFRCVNDRTEKLQRTGYSAFAESDGIT